MDDNKGTIPDQSSERPPNTKTFTDHSKEHRIFLYFCAPISVTLLHIIERYISHRERETERQRQRGRDRDREAETKGKEKGGPSGRLNFAKCYEKAIISKQEVLPIICPFQ